MYQRKKNLFLKRIQKSIVIKKNFGFSIQFCVFGFSRSNGLIISNKIIFTDETASKDKPLSFLTSLSLESPSDCCHPDALKYVKNFSKTKDELLQRLFLMFNKEAFDNQLPADMLLLWNTRLTRSAGVCVQRKIRFVQLSLQLRAIL